MTELLNEPRKTSLPVPTEGDVILTRVLDSGLWFWPPIGQLDQVRKP
jgi:hypothetical protein